MISFQWKVKLALCQLVRNRTLLEQSSDTVVIFSYSSNIRRRERNPENRLANRGLSGIMWRLFSIKMNTSLLTDTLRTFSK